MTSRRPNPFRAHLLVRFGDIDEAGFVYYPTARLEVDFNRPLHYGDQLEIEVTITRVGKTSIGWRYRIFRPGEAEPATEAHLVTVNMNMDTHEKKEIPDWLREQLEDYKGQAEGSE
jgi:acyl-CoA thioesterase FadM